MGRPPSLVRKPGLEGPPANYPTQAKTGLEWATREYPLKPKSGLNGPPANDPTQAKTGLEWATLSQAASCARARL